MVGWQLGGVDGWWRVEWEVREERGIVSSNLSPLKERNHFSQLNLQWEAPHQLLREKRARALPLSIPSI